MGIDDSGLAPELENKHSYWGYERIAAEIRKRLEVKVPSTIVYSWLKGRRPCIVSLRLPPELGYAVGALMTNCAKGCPVRLRVRDRDFAEESAKALIELTGKRY